MYKLYSLITTGVNNIDYTVITNYHSESSKKITINKLLCVCILRFYLK